jgi:23S rRNA (cytosine1962-C5)-methyltransferase
VYDRALAPERPRRSSRETMVGGPGRAVSPAAPDLAVGLGDLVELVDDDGPVATAFADPGSPIRARILGDADLEPDAAWAEARAGASAARRARDPLLVGCTGRRLVHGEGDGCPGLVVDAYDDTAVVVFDGAAAAAFWRPRLDGVLAGLDRHAELAHIWVRARGAKAQGSAVRGDPPVDIAITEDEARFGVDIRAGQKTGFFLDQRENRRLIRRHAAGATVLNLFAYTGGFSLHAALGGASRVTSVDIAAPAVAAIATNLELSALAKGTHELVCADAFEFLADATKAGRRWDLVIADPPSFAPNERARQSALAAYRKLAIATLEVVEPGGRLAFASCSSHVHEADLLELMPPGVRARSITGAASDHPVLPAFPEGRYLDFLLFDVD